MAKKLGKPRLGKPKPKPGDKTELTTQQKLAGLGARRQPGSGNYIGRKGDVDVREPESLLLESKETEGQSLQLQMSWLRKITREARGVRKVGGLVIGFTRVRGPTPSYWMCLPLDVCERLINAAGWDALTTDEGV